MVDTHYDLLTICYICYLKNDYSLIEEIKKNIENNKGNIKAIFANLYFMSIEEMKEELGENYYNDSVSILEMFKISKQILEEYLPDVDFIYSIEGCDYLDISDLKPLYDEGLRSIIMVWNNENIYGSGIKTDKGLTDLGKKFINEAIKLGYGIDLSHANLETFYGIINQIKLNIQNGYDVVCYASHSNSRFLCDRARNLTDDQLEQIKSVNGQVGVVSHKRFVSSCNDNLIQQKKYSYMQNINHIGRIIGFDNVMLSTDDMSFLKNIDPEYASLPIYNYSEIYDELREDFELFFNEEDTLNILYRNAYKKIINKLRNKTNDLGGKFATK